MEKLAYLIHRELDVPGPDLRAALVEKAAPALRDAGASSIGVSVHDEHVAAGDAVAIRRAAPPIRGLVTFWMQNSDDRARCEEILDSHAARIAGYLVVESRPLVHEPPIGERAPGANLVTTIKKRADISQDQFIDRWNNEHRKVAVEIQSTFGYVRNAVVRALTPGAFAWDGIVEESFPLEALSNPHVWYDCDDAAEYQRRLKRMIESVSAFLDLGQMESTPMSEYWLG
jgi:hypothetical protein